MKYEIMDIKNFYKGKKVLVTGHTGFKGSWLIKELLMAGADVTGYALEPSTVPTLFKLAEIEKDMHSVYGDIRDFDRLAKTFMQVRPEIVFHLAAQPIVRESYKEPRMTYETNVMGTVNLLECVRNSDCTNSVVNITTDKVYKNNEWVWGYRETDPLDGYDPYSNSKSCSELVTSSYINSFFKNMGIPVSTARAGNVIGGGDFAENRIIPDCIRAVTKSQVIEVRNPYSVRPYQHVLEALYCYLLIAAGQSIQPAVAGNFNIGPDDCDCITTGQLADLFCKYWGNTASWTACNEEKQLHEANFLKLDCSKIKNTFGWSPKWNVNKAVEMTCEFTKEWIDGVTVSGIMEKQINKFLDHIR